MNPLPSDVHPDVPVLFVFLRYEVAKFELFRIHVVIPPTMVYQMAMSKLSDTLSDELLTRSQYFTCHTKQHTGPIQDGHKNGLTSVLSLHTTSCTVILVMDTMFMMMQHPHLLPLHKPRVPTHCMQCTLFTMFLFIC